MAPRSEGVFTEGRTWGKQDAMNFVTVVVEKSTRNVVNQRSAPEGSILGC